MGRIVEEVENRHLANHPTERAFLQPFLPLFDVTWAGSETQFGTTVSCYFLKPERRVTQSFGFEREVLLTYSPYPKFEPRIIQLVHRFMSRIPATTRVESLCFILVYDDPRIREGISQITTSSVQAKAIVPFYRLELEGADQWFVSNRIAENFFSRDLFDMTQNLIEDTYFFGRQTLVQDLVDRFRRGQNTGIFGLRKTGKTSTISKVGRTIEMNGLGHMVVLDANDPAQYQQRWWQLLGTVVSKIAEATGVQPPTPVDAFQAAATAAAAFSASMNYVFSRLAGAQRRVVLVIDEYEHICPQLSLAGHWSQDYLPFWQTLRAYQGRRSEFSFMVAGVNPHMAEVTTVSGHDNPLFSLIPKLFLPSFSRAEVREMVRTLARYMGFNSMRIAMSTSVQDMEVIRC